MTNDYRARIMPPDVALAEVQSGQRVYIHNGCAEPLELVQALTRIEGVAAAFDAPRFHEAVLTLDRPAAPVLAALAAHGIAGGLDLGASFPELGQSLLVCATETKLDVDIEAYADALAHVMNQPLAARGVA